MLRAPARISQRWKSATGSLARRDWLLPPGWPLVRDEPPLPDWLQFPDWPPPLSGWLLLLLLFG